jgi:hypothetical protein
MLRVILIGAVAVLASCATAPATSPPTAQAQEAQRPPCAPEATRIPSKDCGPGRTYDDQAVKSTGRPETGNALQMLDPSVTVHH